MRGLAWQLRGVQRRRLLDRLITEILNYEEIVDDPSFLFWFCRRILRDLEACRKDDKAEGTSAPAEGFPFGTTAEATASASREEFHSGIDVQLREFSRARSEWQMLRCDLLKKLQEPLLSSIYGDLQRQEHEDPKKMLGADRATDDVEVPDEDDD